MAFQITSLAPAQVAHFDDIIDVRAPAEFAEDHIPGAINLPAFSDAERAEVGTIYVQQSAFKARKIGAALLARNVAAHLDGPLSDKGGAWQPLIYCWRGGQRSGGVTSILSQIGWRAERLDGGYKSYRRLVVQKLYETPLPHRFVLLDGNTGSGKTAILHALTAQGVQVLDLEGLAEHRGSLLGAMGQAQPSQKMFESRLALAMAGLDPAKPVVVEAESSKIGARLIPAAVWKTMLAAPRIDVVVPMPARARFLARDYADALIDPAEMSARMDKLRTICGHEQVTKWQVLLQQGRYEGLAASLMELHYDPSYRRSRMAKEFDLLGRIDVPELDEDGIARAAGAVSALLDQV